MEDFEDMVVLTKEEFTKIALDLFQAGATHANDISSVNFLSEVTTNNFTEYINKLFE